MEEFNLGLPKVKKIEADSLASQLQSVQPIMGGPPIKRKYKDHMGNDVIEYESGRRSMYSYSSTHLYGDWGHSFGRGFFVVDETGNMVFAGDERYNELVEKGQPYWKILKALQEKFPEYRIEPSRGERLAVNDKIIKGFLFHPGMLRIRENSDVEKEIQETVDFISSEIQLDIDRGRIVKGEYGAE
jgi:hypothetical protein